MDTSDLLVNLVLALTVAAASAAIAARLGQSVILGYIAAGMLIGTHTPGFVADPDMVDALANIGIILLMFAIGIQVSVQDLLRVGRVALIGGHIQIAATIALGYLAVTALGWPTIQALFFGAVISNSSSTVLTKVLNERAEAGSLHGRIGLAWSSVQDLNTIVLVVVLTAISGGNGSELWTDLLIAGGQAVLFLAILLPVGSKVLPIVFARIAMLHNREVFVLVAAALALGMALLATLFGLSAALGAFVAGIVLSESDVRHEVLDGLLPLRDIFAGLFFVSVGMLVNPGFVLGNLGTVAITVLLIVVAKGALSAVITLAFRYPVRTALLTGVTLAQSAEFSFVMARLGADLGALTEDAFSLMLAGAVISVLLAPALHHAAAPLGVRLERRYPQRADAVEDAEQAPPGLRDHAVLIGHGRVGHVIANALRQRGVPFAVIDQDRATIARLREEQVPAYLGSADNTILLDRMNLERARLLLVAIPDAGATRRIVTHAHRVNPTLEIVARTHTAPDRDALEAMGVHEAVLGELELAMEMTRYALHTYGVDPIEATPILTDLRADMSNDRTPGA